MNAYRTLSWLFALSAAACFVVGGWLWWNDRDVPLLEVDAPVVEVGSVPRNEPRVVEVSVKNTSSHTLHLAGLDGESC